MSNSTTDRQEFHMDLLERIDERLRLARAFLEHASADDWLDARSELTSFPRVEPDRPKIPADGLPAVDAHR